ncbi:hypothetical protein RRG08_044284 [Elysia crispata]|uniref:Uncharacterized protein n=1 Tax=Elysia crispata TaxID=231223 RepID=A0AAE0XYA6_9GAST|nr:hypothetical protein RRG08_044284 [Elysia crispata]
MTARPIVCYPSSTCQSCVQLLLPTKLHRTHLSFTRKLSTVKTSHVSCLRLDFLPLETKILVRRRVKLRAKLGERPAHNGRDRKNLAGSPASLAVSNLPAGRGLMTNAQLLLPGAVLEMGLPSIIVGSELMNACHHHRRWAGLGWAGLEAAKLRCSKLARTVAHQQQQQQRQGSSGTRGVRYHKVNKRGAERCGEVRTPRRSCNEQSSTTLMAN